MEEKDKELIENLKVVIIYGENIVDGENNDGVMERIYGVKIDFGHESVEML